MQNARCMQLQITYGTEREIFSLVFPISCLIESMQNRQPTQVHKCEKTRQKQICCKIKNTAICDALKIPIRMSMCVVNSVQFGKGLKCFRTTYIFAFYVL